MLDLFTIKHRKLAELSAGLAGVSRRRVAGTDPALHQPRQVPDQVPRERLVAALVIDALVLGLFAIQHSVMVRPGS